MMLGSEIDPFYGDNENPYVDIRLYAADNFLEAISMYVRKHAAHDRVNAARSEQRRGQRNTSTMPNRICRT